VAELSGDDPLFALATDILAEVGNDFRELYRAAEAISKAHGGFPKKERRAARLAFCAKLEASEDNWEAIHRSARPSRHAVPHDMEGPRLTARQARLLIQHALKLWLEREVPT
jgi:hypothetical protein